MLSVIHDIVEKCDKSNYFTKMQSRTLYHVRQRLTHFNAPSTPEIIRRFSAITNNGDISPTSSKQLRNVDENSDDNRLLKLCQLEIYQLRDNGKRAPNPESMTKSQWENLYQLKTKSARFKYYAHLSRLEILKEKSEMTKQTKKQAYLAFKERQALEEPQTNQHIAYGLTKTTFFLRIRKDVINKWRNNNLSVMSRPYFSRLARAMQYGNQLVFDCSYDQHMNTHEAKSAAKQLMMSFAANRNHKLPFDLHFCNANFNYDTMKCLERYIPTMRNKEFPMHVHEESYLDLFPKEKLVYLTPHCKEDLIEFDPDSIYIIAAMLENRNQLPLSLGKAKELGLRMARLPLDSHLKWCGGSGKSLTMDQMTLIMLDFQATKNWEYAFRHVPKRKLVDHVAPPTTGIRKGTENIVSRRECQLSDDNALSMDNRFKEKVHAKKVGYVIIKDIFKN